jgi:hypothetical protein
MLVRVVAAAALSTAAATAITCEPGTYFSKYGPACGQDCCDCVPGNFCPGGSPKQQMFPCPAGTCSPSGAAAASECAAPACPGAPSISLVEQVHIALTGVAGEMSVSFASNRSCDETVTVAYGPTPSFGSAATATGALLTSGMDTPLCIFGAVLTGVARGGARTYYKVDGDGSGFSFVYEPVRAGGLRYLVMADYGAENDISQQQLVEDASAGLFDATIYSGDMAYDFPTQGGLIGNQFMRVLEPFAAVAPFHAVVGNHERADNFSQFRARFAGYELTAAASTSPSPLFYSFNHGLVHFVGISTEIFSYGGANVQDMCAD